MKRVFPLFLCVILVLGIMSCAEKEAPPAIALEDLNAGTLWKHMNQDDAEELRQRLAGLEEIRGFSPYVRTQVLLLTSGRPVGATWA